MITEKKVVMYRHQLLEFYSYINNCRAHKIKTESKTLTELIKFHLQELYNKLSLKWAKMQVFEESKTKVKFTYAELLTLSYVFKNIPVSPSLLGIEYTILANL